MILGARELFETVKDRGQKEPRQKEDADEVLDVPEEDVRSRQEPDHPEGEADECREEGAQQDTVESASGTTIRLIGTSTANITASTETAWASTAAVGITSRGNQTFLIMLSLPGIELMPV